MGVYFLIFLNIFLLFILILDCISNMYNILKKNRMLCYSPFNIIIKKYINNSKEIIKQTIIIYLLINTLIYILCLILTLLNYNYIGLILILLLSININIFNKYVFSKKI